MPNLFAFLAIFISQSQAIAQGCYRILGDTSSPGMAASVHIADTLNDIAVIHSYGPGASGQDFWWYEVSECSVMDSGYYQLPGHNLLLESDRSTSGRYVMGGITDTTLPYATVLVADSGHQLLWTQNLQLPSRCAFHTVCWHPDGGVVAAGYVHGNTSNDFLVVKYTSSGNHEWTYVSGSDKNEYVQAVRISAMGDIVFVGDREQASGEYEVLLVRLDNSGNEIWTSVLNTGFNTGSQNLQVLPDGSYMVCGETSSVWSSYFDFYIALFDQTGNPTSFRNYPAHPTQGDASFTAEWLGFGKVLLAGYGASGGISGTDMVCQLVDTIGTSEDFWFSSGAGTENAYDLAVLGSKFYVAGETDENGVRQAVYATAQVDNLGLQHEQLEHKEASMVWPWNLPLSVDGKYELFDLSSGRALSGKASQVIFPSVGHYILRTTEGIKRIVAY